MPRKEPLTETETILLGHLKDLLHHVRSHDANGNVSQQFCLGCERKRNEECVLPNILKSIDLIENGAPVEAAT
jgi:hypothetical protein